MEDTSDFYTIQVPIDTDRIQSPNCEVCRNGIIHLSSLQVREFSHSGKLSKACKICTKEILRQCRLQIRDLSKNSTDLHQCQLCPKAYAYAGNLRKHMSRHSNKNDAFIKKHQLSHATAMTASDHASKMIKLVENESDVDDPSPLTSQDGSEIAESVSSEDKSDLMVSFHENVCFCKICCREFKNECSFTKHFQTHGDKNFYCGLCRESYDSMYELRNHNRDVHVVANQYLCNVCCTVFTNIMLLKDHCLTFHNNVINGEIVSKKDLAGRPVFTCEICKRRFVQNTPFQKHLKLHEGKTNVYHCEVCDKEFLLRFRLDLHREMEHGKPKYFSCSACDKTFLLEAEYEGHLQCHIEDGADDV